LTKGNWLSIIYVTSYLLYVEEEIKMNEIDKKAYIWGSIFSLANRLQILGDKLDKNISIKQWLLIAIISKFEHSSPTLGEVADTIGNSRQNVKKMAVILQSQGFVSLTKDVNDGRMVRISLTPKCIAYFQDRAEKELQFIEKLFDAFDETLTDGLYQGFIKLVENTVEMEKRNETNERN
jgi:DNA-binding MarR family transcriptional regulator